MKRRRHPARQTPHPLRPFPRPALSVFLVTLSPCHLASPFQRPNNSGRRGACERLEECARQGSPGRHFSDSSPPAPAAALLLAALAEECAPRPNRLAAVGNVAKRRTKKLATLAMLAGRAQKRGGWHAFAVPSVSMLTDGSKPPATSTPARLPPPDSCARLARTTGGPRSWSVPAAATPRTPAAPLRSDPAASPAAHPCAAG